MQKKNREAKTMSRSFGTRRKRKAKAGHLQICNPILSKTPLIFSKVGMLRHDLAKSTLHARRNCAVTRKGEMQFDPKKHD